MNLLFVDTETTGCPADNSKSYKAIDNWPSIRQIAWLVYTKDGEFINGRNYEIGTGDGIHNLGVNYLPKIESPIFKVLPVFLKDLSKCDVIIGHNIEFDVNVILCEVYRLGLDTNYLESIPQFCTMKNSVEVCGFDTIKGDRYPKLQELYTKLFHRPFDNAHDAYCDIKATADCYWEMFNNACFELGSFPYLLSEKRKAFLARDYAQKADSLWRFPATISFHFHHIINESDGSWIADRPYRRVLGKDEQEIELEKLSKEAIDNEWNVIKDYYDKAIDYYLKAANLGHIPSMVRLGSIYYNRHEMELASIWYVEAIDRGYIGLDCFFQCAEASAVYWLNQDKCHKFYAEWAQLCEADIATIPDIHLWRYIDAFKEGRYGQEKNVEKAIEICNQALALNRHHGVRERLIELLDAINDRPELIKQFSIFISEENAGNRRYLRCLEEKIVRYLIDGDGVPQDSQMAKMIAEDMLSLPDLSMDEKQTYETLAKRALGGELNLSSDISSIGKESGSELKKLSVLFIGIFALVVFTTLIILCCVNKAN